MSNLGKIIGITPGATIGGGEVFIECENIEVRSGGDIRCFFNMSEGDVSAASPNRIIAFAPEDDSELIPGGSTRVQIYNENGYTEPFSVVVGRRLTDDLHQVANPAVDPEDNNLIVTRSGSRGQQLPVTLFRLDKDGDVEDITGDILNPTGVAFAPNGDLFVTSRAEGSVYRVTRADEVVPFASGMGIASGIAFDKNGEMYVGDRSGTIYKVNAIGETEVFATLEQSIAAYHLAFGLDGALYVTRPNVASYDSIMRVDADGEVTTFFRGLGRPQGLAFDRDGNLYVAACLKQRRGIVKITPDGSAVELFVAGMNIVGLCFGKSGEMFVATSDSIFSLPLGIHGILV